MYSSGSLRLTVVISIDIAKQIKKIVTRKWYIFFGIYIHFIPCMSSIMLKHPDIWHGARPSATNMLSRL